MEDEYNYYQSEESERSSRDDEESNSSEDERQQIKLPTSSIEHKIETILLPTRANRLSQDKKFKSQYNTLLTVLNSKKSRRTDDDTHYINTLSKELVNTADILNQVATQELNVSRSITSSLARQVQKSKNSSTLEKKRQDLVSEINALDYERTRIETKTLNVRKKIKNVQEQILNSNSQESRIASEIISANAVRRELETSIAESSHLEGQLLRTEDESLMYQSRVSALHKSHEKYVREGRDRYNDAEAQLFATRREIDDVKRSMSMANENLYNVQGCIDELAVVASRLNTRGNHYPPSDDRMMARYNNNNREKSPRGRQSQKQHLNPITKKNTTPPPIIAEKKSKSRKKVAVPIASRREWQ